MSRFTAIWAGAVAALCAFATWRYGFSWSVAAALAEVPALVALERVVDAWRGRRNAMSLASERAAMEALDGVRAVQLELERTKERLTVLQSRVGTR